MHTIDGRCHCGNIAFKLHWPEDNDRIAVRACSCTFCTKHGGVYTSHPQARLEACVRDAGALNRYTFGTATAEFHVCRVCGAMPFVTSVIDGTTYAVVNANTFENVDRATFDNSTADFNGEDLQQRLARRKRNWIASVDLNF